MDLLLSQKMSGQRGQLFQILVQELLRGLYRTITKTQARVKCVCVFKVVGQMNDYQREPILQAKTKDIQMYQIIRKIFKRQGYVSVEEFIFKMHIKIDVGLISSRHTHESANLYTPPPTHTHRKEKDRDSKRARQRKQSFIFIRSTGKINTRLSLQTSLTSPQFGCSCLGRVKKIKFQHQREKQPQSPTSS